MQEIKSESEALCYIVVYTHTFEGSMKGYYDFIDK